MISLSKKVHRDIYYNGRKLTDRRALGIARLWMRKTDDRRFEIGTYSYCRQLDGEVEEKKKSK